MRSPGSGTRCTGYDDPLGTRVMLGCLALAMLAFVIAMLPLPYGVRVVFHVVEALGLLTVFLLAALVAVRHR